MRSGEGVELKNDAAHRTRPVLPVDAIDPPAPSVDAQSTISPQALPIDYARPENQTSRRKVVLILGIIAALMVAGLALAMADQARHVKHAKAATAVQELSTMNGALDVFESDAGRYPTSNEGLAALQVRPLGIKDWHGPYLSRFGNDPWGHPYIYRCPGTGGPHTFDLFSTGPDGRPITGNDVWLVN
jgi:general secretion pathway protein G